MALTSGFFNAVKSDRRYNAEEMGEIFDGIITDGILANIGQHFAVTTASNGLQINVGTGRAWFDHTWTKNDSVMVLTVEQPDISRDRIDAVVLEVNHDDAVRANSIYIVKGTASVNPQKPDLPNSDKVKLYPLAYITVKVDATEIKAEDIENAIGLTPCPFATGILQTTPIDELWEQWRGEWNTWFANIKLQLTEDVVTNLQYQIEEVKDSIKFLNEKFQVVEVVHNDVVSTTGSWQNTTGDDLQVVVKVFGSGGGSGASYTGGGGGHMASWSGTIAAGQSVPITIGAAGINYSGSSTGSGSNGGTCSFGSYVSASGGGGGGAYIGGDGGTGGGGYGAPAAGQGRGGNGSYGGGGGGGGAAFNHNSYGNYYAYATNGGSGGTYGGGGGGGGGAWAASGGAGTQLTAGSGGSGGAYGGRGGNGGNNVTSSTASSGSSGNSGINTNSLSVEFKGSGYGGSGGSAGTHTNGSTTLPGSGGGGGGGGYGGNGGNGGKGDDGDSTSSVVWWSDGGGGGGGGGYGASGGPGRSETTPARGGGGGGYGGAGRGSGGGGYGTNNFGAGGGSTVDYYDSQITPISGVCIITYITREIHIKS